MLRVTLIPTLVLAIAFGSIGMPVYAHSCKMMDKVFEAKTCGMCGSHEDEEDTGLGIDGLRTDKESDADPCCQTNLTHKKTDPTVQPVANLEVQAPVFLPVLLFAPFVVRSPDFAVGPKSPNRVHSPPDLKYDQSAWLVNASFLL